MKILSLSCVYPNPAEPLLGVFVRARLRRVAESAEVKVMAPVPVFDYWSARNGKGMFYARVPARMEDGPIEVLYPRWIHLPFGAALHAILLCAEILIPVRRLHSRFAFELIDAHFACPTGIAAGLLARAVGVPFLVTLRGNETLYAKRFLCRLLMRRELRRAARVICVSDRLRDFAISLGVESAKAITIPNGIDTERFRPHDRAQSRREMGLPQKGRIVLTAGGLIERKGHHRVIRALDELRREGLEAHLAIAGAAAREGHYEAEIRGLVAKLGMESTVTFLGAVKPERMPVAMSAADVFCLASTREGWPNVVHEAMACGTPVVATDVGGVPDMIPSAEYGVIIPIDDAVALRDALRQALTKSWDCEAIARLARARSWEKVGLEVVEQMQAVLAGETPGQGSDRG
jgi:glycosyltransferase involved in cell wall biosynthesis